MCMCMYVQHHVCGDTAQAVVNYPMWVLGTKPRSNTLNH